MTGRVDSSMVTSANGLDGYRVVRNFGIVRGITVRSRSVLGNLAAGFQTIVGGNITILTELAKRHEKKHMSCCCSTPRRTGRTRF